MELRRSETLTVLIVFILSQQLRVIFAQTVMTSFITRTNENGAVKHTTVSFQSPPSVLSNPVVDRLKNALLRPRRNRNRRGAGRRYSIEGEFLRAHNRVRRRAKETPFMWNATLAGFARDWAQKRVDDCKLVHSNGPYGENIFWGGDDHWQPAEVVQSWADEYKYYNVNSLACLDGQMCGHYTQIVWRDTRTIGCARARCKNGGVFVICVYDPPGNYEGENPFGSFVN